jgi:DNA replication protein DnaC
MRKYKMDSLYAAALMTDSQKQHIVLKVDQDSTDLEQFKQLASIEQNICKFIEEGQNLYIHSANCGNGKSSWSIRLAEAYFNKIWARTNTTCRVLFISVPRFLLALKDNITTKSTYVEYIKDHVFEADLVIWDDIAAKMGSEFELTHLLNIIDNRIALGKSNIYTSNLNRQQLYTALGERLTSRIANMSIDIELFGSDKRFLKLEGN